jgi:hypothetical protein
MSAREAAIDVAKAMLWEEAKGKLRALVAVSGCVVSTDPEEPPRFEVVGGAVEAFIKRFENEGLHE